MLKTIGTNEGENIYVGHPLEIMRHQASELKEKSFSSIRESFFLSIM